MKAVTLLRKDSSAISQANSPRKSVRLDLSKVAADHSLGTFSAAATPQSNDHLQLSVTMSPKGLVGGETSPAEPQSDKDSTIEEVEDEESDYDGHERKMKKEKFAKKQQ